MITPRKTRCFLQGWRDCLVMLLLIVAVSGGLLYWRYDSWCWGKWGRDNALMHYLFECRCPAASEAARYQPFQVMVSACVMPLLADISPSRRSILLYRQDTGLVHLDMETGQVQPVSQTVGNVHFLSDELVLTSHPDKGAFLIDLTDGTRTSAVYVGDLYKTLPSEPVRQALKNADQVYKVWHYFVALAPDYKRSPDENVVIVAGGSDDWHRLDPILEELGVSATEIPSSSQKTGQVHGAWYSQDGQLWADPAGIYLSDTGKLIVPTGQSFPGDQSQYRFGVEAWVNNDRAVIYGGGGYRYLIGGGGFSPRYLPYPLPILLLEVPPKYWPEPTTTPAP